MRAVRADIKGANILVDPSGKVKLADFGCSKKFSNATVGTANYKSIVGTPWWMAPEVIKSTGYGRAADIWSLGCTIIEMATCHPPWSECTNMVRYRLFPFPRSRSHCVVGLNLPPSLSLRTTAARWPPYSRSLTRISFPTFPRPSPGTARTSSPSASSGTAPFILLCGAATAAASDHPVHSPESPSSDRPQPSCCSTRSSPSKGARTTRPTSTPTSTSAYHTVSWSRTGRD